jgi:hypothetical protein
MPIRCTVVCLLLATGGAALVHAGGQQPSGGIAVPAETPRRPVGVKALNVTPGAEPPFTHEDVAAYFQGHDLPRNLAPREQLSLASLELLTAAEVTGRLGGARTGLKDDERVGFAVLEGTLVFSGPPGGPPAQFSRGYAVFDAATGNLLMFGTLAE